MEITLNGEWNMVVDNDELGENQKWNLPGNFPKQYIPFHVPAFCMDKPFKSITTAWMKKKFQFSKNENSYVYLAFFGSDAGTIWVNGQEAGKLKKTTEKQVFEISKLLEDNNTIIIKFKELTELSHAIWKNVYVIENSSVPAIAKSIVSHTPPWVDKAVIYSIYTRNFSPEGTFNAVSERLQKIKSLGANTLWFLPIHPVGENGRKGKSGSPYSIKDYYAIDPAYGTKEDFKALVEKAHSMDMKVIIDLVINHTAKDSVMKDIDTKFYKSEDKQAAHKWGWTDVEDLDYEYEPTREYIKKMMEYWITEFDIDGYRCDVAFLVPLDFWKESITYIRSIKKDILMLAEADNAELYPAGFDLTYDWYLMSMFQKIDKGYYNIFEISKYIHTQFEYFPQNSRRLIFMENHDTERAAEVISAKMLCPFQLLKYSIPGIPLIYNGEEVGQKHRPDLFEKDSIDWKDSNDHMVDYLKEVAKIKRNYPSLSYHQPGSFDTREEISFYQISRSNMNRQVDIIFDTKNFDSHIYVKGKHRRTLVNRGI